MGKEQAANAQEFIKKLNHINDIPTLPDIAIKVNEMLGDMDTSINQLGAALEKDQGMVSKIMKLVNSSFFGLRSKVKGIPNAIVLLGFNTVRNAVLSVSIVDSFKTGSVKGIFDIRDFWKHSVTVAVISRYLGRRTNLYSPEECFVGGILHDMGKIILVQYFPELFCRVIATAKENELTFIDAEKKEYPYDHARIGGYLSKKWGLPNELVNAIKNHHSVTKNAHELSTVVYAANIIANGPKDKAGETHEALPGSVNRLIDAVPEWYPDISDEIESASKFFLKG